MKMYKYEIEEELKHIPDIQIDWFRKYLDKITANSNKIILFKNKDYSGYYCTKCKTWHFMESKKLESFKRKKYLTCGNCRTRLEVIYRNNKIDDFCDYITLIESNYRSELIIRLFFYKRVYDKKYGQFYEEFYEVERMNLNHGVAMKNNSYKVMGNWSIFHGPTRKGWIKDRTEFYTSYYYDNVYTTPKVIRNIIKTNEKFKYSCLDLAIKNEISTLSYLKLWINYPKIELLMKTGCTKIVKEICKGGTYVCSPHILNKLDKKGINILRKYNLSYRELETYQKTLIEDYSILKKGASINYASARLNHNAKKVINYLYEKKYSIRDYEDYIGWCNELGMNLNDKNILYPDDPREAHNRVLKEKTKYEERKFDEDISRFAQELANLKFEEKGLIIKPAESQKELIIESEKLDHCVRTYAKRMAKRETSIFFIRRKESQNEPYVTLELRNKKVIQCRGYKNNIRKPLEEKVKTFVNDWCREKNLISCFN